MPFLNSKGCKCILYKVNKGVILIKHLQLYHIKKRNIKQVMFLLVNVYVYRHIVLLQALIYARM